MFGGVAQLQSPSHSRRRESELSSTTRSELIPSGYEECCCMQHVAMTQSALQQLFNLVSDVFVASVFRASIQFSYCETALQFCSSPTSVFCGSKEQLVIQHIGGE
jgi:hypothetical protein